MLLTAYLEVRKRLMLILKNTVIRLVMHLKPVILNTKMSMETVS